MKKFLSVLVCISIILSGFFTASAEENGNINVFVNGNLLETDQPAVIINDRTMVPMRAIVEALGCEVEWDDESKTAIIFNTVTNLNVQVENCNMMKLALTEEGINAENIEIDAPPVIINSRIMVPVRAISEGISAKVLWDDATKTVSVVTEPDAITETNEAEKPIVASELDKSEPIHIIITLSNNKEIEADLYPHIAPKTVENFVKLINEKFFDGLIFHRVIPGFMIQGGGYDESFYDGNFNSKECDAIEGEFKSNGFANDLKHAKGVLSMARTNEPNSASSQFFIMHEDAPHLDGEYAAFGEVTKGIEAVDEIATGETTAVNGYVEYMGQEYSQQMSDVPVKPVIIKTIKIVK